MRILLLVFPAVLAAHDLYLKPKAFTVRPGEGTAVEFHNGDAFPNSQVPPVLARVRGARVIWGKGEQGMVNLRVTGKSATADYVAPGAAGFLLVAETRPNFIQLAAGKFEEYLKHENLGQVVEWRKAHGETGKAGREMYSKYVKAIVHTGGADSFVTKPVGQAIEFVPLTDPAGEKAGGVLRVRLLVRGAAAKDVAVEASWVGKGKVQKKVLGRTDGNGEIAVPLVETGFWRLHAIHMGAYGDKKQADWESLWASLTFAVER